MSRKLIDYHIFHILLLPNKYPQKDNCGDARGRPRRRSHSSSGSGPDFEGGDNDDETPGSSISAMRTRSRSTSVSPVGGGYIRPNTRSTSPNGVS